MASKIPYLIFLGIIFVTNGTPDNRDNSRHEEPSHYFKQLMKDFLTQGNYDVLLNHHEDRKGAHHEDTTKLTYKGNKPSNRYYGDPYHNEDSNQDVDGNNLNYKLLLNLFNRKRTRNQKTVDDGHNISDKISWNANAEKNYIDRSNEIKRFLNNLDNKLNLNSRNSYKVVCYGEDCDHNKNEGRPNSNGDGYRSRNKNDDDRNNRDIQCGNRCKRTTNYLDGSMFTEDINHILRSSNNKYHKMNDRDVNDDVKSDRDGYKEAVKTDDNNRYDSDIHRDNTEGNMEYRDDTRDAIDSTNDNRYEMVINRNFRDEFQCPGNTCVRARHGSMKGKFLPLMPILGHVAARVLIFAARKAIEHVVKNVIKNELKRSTFIKQKIKGWVDDVKYDVFDFVSQQVIDAVAPDDDYDYDYGVEIDVPEPTKKTTPKPKPKPSVGKGRWWGKWWFWG